MTEEKRYPSVNWPATEIKDLKDRIAHLEAARDHLRARLRELSEQWMHNAARIDSFHATMGTGWKACAADLLAVLTEPPHEKNDEKIKENDTRSAETDVTREVPLPQPPTESQS